MDAQVALDDVYEAVLDGDQQAALVAVEASLTAGVPAGEILQDGMIAAMEEVGRLFEEGDYFVPEMLVAARAMKSGLTILEPHMTDDAVESKGKVILGTVEGDLHDIGKNLVAMMLQGAGFEIVDVGTDVSPEEFVEVVKVEQADLLGLSALLTTTLPSMEATLQAIADAGLRSQIKVLVGGAPVTADYATRIGADGYAADASQAVTMAKQLVA